MHAPDLLRNWLRYVPDQGYVNVLVGSQVGLRFVAALVSEPNVVVAVIAAQGEWNYVVHSRLAPHGLAAQPTAPIPQVDEHGHLDELGDSLAVRGVWINTAARPPCPALGTLVRPPRPRAVLPPIRAASVGSGQKESMSGWAAPVTLAADVRSGRCLLVSRPRSSHQPVPPFRDIPARQLQLPAQAHEQLPLEAGPPPAPPIVRH